MLANNLFVKLVYIRIKLVLYPEKFLNKKHPQLRGRFLLTNNLLQGDFRTGRFQGLLDGFGFFLLRAFLNHFRSAINQVLGFL